MSDGTESENVEGLIEDIIGHFELLVEASGEWIEDLAHQHTLEDFDEEEQEDQYYKFVDLAAWAKWCLHTIEAHNNAILAISALVSDNPADFEERLRIMGFLTTFLQTYSALCSLHWAAASGSTWVHRSEFDQGHLEHVLRRICDVNRVAVLELRNRGRLDVNTPANQATQEEWHTKPASASRADELPCAWPALAWQKERLRRERNSIDDRTWATEEKRRAMKRYELVTIPNPEEEPLLENEEAIDVAGIVVGPHDQPRLPAVTYAVQVRVKFGEGASSKGYIKRTWYTGNLS
jgi:hypothetical protein